MALKGAAGRTRTAFRAVAGGVARYALQSSRATFPTSFFSSGIPNPNLLHFMFPLRYQDYLTQPRGERNTARRLFIGGGRGQGLS